jgi:crotonobetainyl-CoA:carnitine CoA-transferase CaiB-like acyl-CoA transferase
LKGALSHLRIIDLTHYIAGPYCTKLMAGFGAEVIKVERLQTGDKMRSMGPFYKNEAGLERSIPFLWLNTGKKSITLDLKSDRGKEILKSLVKGADVLVENFSPRVMAELGLNYESLHEINPRLVMTSISNFGQTGPYRNYKAEEIQAYAMSGLMYETGDPEKAPLASGPALSQYTAAMIAYVGTLIALYYRSKTGLGQHVDVSVQEAALVNIEMSLVECLQMGRVRKRQNDRHGMVPWELYECADGEVAVISGPLRHWRRAAEIFNDPRLFDRKYDHCLSRRTFRDEFEALLRPSIKKFKKKELFLAGQERKLGFAYLANLDDALQSPQHRHRRLFVEIDHPVVGRHKYTAWPFILSENPWTSTRAPLIGEHNTQIFSGLSGRSKAQIKEHENMSSNLMDTMPFVGLRVLDFSHEWAAPISSRILGDFGAEVIKVEYARRMCVVRGARLEDHMYDHHPRWHQINRNKLSVTLDLNLKDDLEVFKELVKSSDIMVSNSRPVVLEKFGLTYPELKQIQPDIIMASMFGFGATGPYSTFAGFGGTIEPLSGLQCLTAYEKNGKCYRVREMDVCNGLMGACAVMTALIHRQRTGKGQWINLSQFETATHTLMGEHLLEYVMNGTQTLPLGNRHHYYAPQGCYKCQGEDKWVTITVRTDNEWSILCEIIGYPEGNSDTRFVSREDRMRNHDEVDRLIEAWTINQNHYEVMHVLQKAGIPAGAVLNGTELCKDQHLCARNYYMTAEDNPDGGKFPGMPMRLSASPGRLFRRGSDLGQHNQYVLCEIRGHSQEQVRPLREEEIGTGYEPE